MKNCSVPGCTEKATFKVEDNKWLCVFHTAECVHSPENMELTTVDEELQNFRDEGGKLS